jgi:signal transduction histidine kinase/ActR/RegA family two-component response regulator
VYRAIPLRTKFLLSMLVVSTGLTAATLSVVSYNVQKGIRQSLNEELRDSVKTYETFAKQREAMMSRSSELLANLPNVRALMTSEDLPTIQNESGEIWRLSGSDLLVLANRAGVVVAVQSNAHEFDQATAQISLRTALDQGNPRAWWSGNGRLYQVWLQPIYFGPASRNTTIGYLATGYEVNSQAAREFGAIVSSEVAFRSGDTIVASTLAGLNQAALSQQHPDGRDVQQLQVGSERYLASTLALSVDQSPLVSVSVLKSFDKATDFLHRLNDVLLGLGLVSVVSGTLLVFLISHTFTKPLASLVAGVRALSDGNFDFPLSTTSQDEVGEVTVAFDRMRNNLRAAQAEQKQLEDRLRQAHKMEAIGRLAGGVAHDFNNLLTIIRGNSDLLLDRGSLDSAQQRNIDQIQKASNRAVAMTRQLLAFSRMQVLQPRAVDLNLAISEMSKMIPRLIGEHIEFSFEAGTNLSTVMADPGQIEQVFLNLAVNARDAMPDGGKLHVLTANVVLNEDEARKRPPMQPGAYVLFAVSDTGHGMDAETKARIFEPFFTTKELGKGTGLGLATVYGIVKQSGGFIWVESEKGKGATFEVYLPAAQKPAAAAGEPAESRALPGGTETILVVEDETGVRELACSFLRAGGYSVLEASDSGEALRLAAGCNSPIHLLLADVVMPKLSGTELAKRLQASRRDLRVIFMTGYADFSSRSVGAVSIDLILLQKPFSRASLLEKVREVLTVAQVSSLDKTG